MKLVIKVSYLLMVYMLLIVLVLPQASAEAPYEGYNYSYWTKSEPSPVPYVPDIVIDGRNESFGTLNGPDDLYVTADKIYILDTGNNRIVILNHSYEFIAEINSFIHEGVEDHFNLPQGIFVTDENQIYVADTENQRIVELTSTGEFVREIGQPESDVIRSSFEYYPLKVAVDKAKRIYVIGRGVYDGIIEYDADGVFTGFTGANRVTFNPLDYLWRVVATKEQRAKMSLFIPMEFNNLDLDQDGFIYATNAEKDTRTPIQRLNPTGTNVIRQEGYHNIIGDVIFPSIGDMAGGSSFIDILVNENGMYSALDLKRGRIFTYDEDGNLLYTFGKLGNQKGTFKIPSALARVGDKLLVLDKGFHQLVVFNPTEFGRNVNEAVLHYHNGNDDIAADSWRKVLRLNANYEVAYVGIGKALLMEGDNKEAMTYFKNGNSRTYYSKAYKRYRQEILRTHFSTMMSLILLIPTSYLVYRIVRKLLRRRARAIVE